MRLIIRIGFFAYLLLLPTSFVAAQQQASATTASTTLSAPVAKTAALQVSVEHNVMVEVHLWMKSYWQVRLTGSGFVVNDRLVGTALHVADLSPGQHCPQTILPEPCTLRLVVKTFQDNKLAGVHEATVLGTDISSDIAVLHAPTLVNMKPAQFSRNVPVDCDVIQTGNPHGTPNVSTFGKVTSQETQRQIKGDPRWYSLVKFSAITKPGNSGSGVVNELAQYVGVTIASSLTDNTGFMISIQRFEWLLEDLEDKRLLVRKTNKQGMRVWQVRK